MKVKLLDSMGYQVHVADVRDVPRVIVWGARVYLKVRRRTFQEVRHVVLGDTAPDPYTLLSPDDLTPP